jgi:phospholipid/cholesterol/gamma-HCH transport system substrate-binding protein
LESVTTRADSMLSPDVQTQLMATMASIQHAADAVTQLAHDAGPAAKQLPGTLAQLQRTLASTNALVASLNAPRGPLYSNLDKLGSAADRAGLAITQMDDSLQSMSMRLEYETLPRINALAGDVSAAVRSIDQAAAVFSTSPRSVLFGVSPAAPGPGEAGFAWPAAAAATATATAH